MEGVLPIFAIPRFSVLGDPEIEGILLSFATAGHTRSRGRHKSNVHPPTDKPIFAASLCLSEPWFVESLDVDGAGWHFIICTDFCRVPALRIPAGTESTPSTTPRSRAGATSTFSSTSAFVLRGTHRVRLAENREVLPSRLGSVSCRASRASSGRRCSPHAARCHSPRTVWLTRRSTLSRESANAACNSTLRPPISPRFTPQPSTKAPAPTATPASPSLVTQPSTPTPLSPRAAPPRRSNAAPTKRTRQRLHQRPQPPIPVPPSAGRRQTGDSNQRQPSSSSLRTGSTSPNLIYMPPDRLEIEKSQNHDAA